MTLRAAGFVIFRRVPNKVEYLLLKASYGERHWTPPKGHVDPGETDEQTAYRETEEESGFSKNDIKVYQNSKKILEYIANNKPKIVIYWLAELINPNKQPTLSSEHDDYKWLDIEHIDAVAKYEEMLELFHFYDDLIQQSKL